MSLQLVKPHKTVWTVSTWVWLCTSVNTYMKSHITVCLKHLPTIRTLIRSSVAVYIMLMWLQVHDCLKLLLHSEHWYGLSPVWTLMCLFRFPDTLNALSHMRHLYGFSPLWILLWYGIVGFNVPVTNKVTCSCESFATSTNVERSSRWLLFEIWPV